MFGVGTAGQTAADAAAAAEAMEEEAMDSRGEQLQQGHDNFG